LPDGAGGGGGGGGGDGAGGGGEGRAVGPTTSSGTVRVTSLAPPGPHSSHTSMMVVIDGVGGLLQPSSQGPTVMQYSVVMSLAGSVGQTVTYGTVMILQPLGRPP
jgi:hypothetical protein